MQENKPFKSNPALDRTGAVLGEWNVEITSMSFREGFRPP